MTRTGNRIVIKICVFFLTLGLVLSFAGLDSAIAQKSNQGSAPNLGDGEQPLFNGYPKRFDGGGYIDRISKEEIVVDDSFYQLAPSVTFNKRNSKNTSSSSFKEGDFVGIIMGSDGKVASVWLIQKKKK